MAPWVERFEALKSQAEHLASSAQQEADSGGAGTAGRAQGLEARRKVMEMGRLISSMDKLANENLDKDDSGLRVRIQGDIAELQRRQRKILSDARGAGATPAAVPPLRAEETASTRQHADSALLQSQRDGLEAQDMQLDRVEAAVGRVGAQATAVHSEVQGQGRLLDSMDRNVGSVQHRVAGATARVGGVLARMPRKLYYATCFLVPFLLTLALVLLIKKL